MVRTVLITGASRGIGLAIALRCAKEGANICLLAKTATPQPNLPGTIYTAAKEIEAAGGKALPILCDIRDADAVEKAIKQCVDTFGGIDVLINNASAISLTDTESTPIKKYDLMHSINGRGTWVTSKLALPYLKKSKNNPHILTISPPLSFQESFFRNHVTYSISKYNMSLVTFGLAGELREYGVGCNSLWPASAVDTAAVRNIAGGPETAVRSRTPAIMADAAYRIISKPGHVFSGNFLIDELFLRQEGVDNLDQYSVDKNCTELAPDFFVDEADYDRIEQLRSAADAQGKPGNRGRIAKL